MAVTELQAQIPGYTSGTWVIDPVHSEVGFSVRHLMLSKVRGRFAKFEGRIVTPENPLEASVEATIDLSSIDTNNPDRDAHLRSADFFDVARYPTATFSAWVAGWQGTRGTLTGELTLHGVSRPVALQAEYLGYAADPWGGHRAVFTATGTIDREDWGLTWNLPLDGGGLVVSREIRIEIELEAVLQL